MDNNEIKNNKRSESARKAAETRAKNREETKNIWLENYYRAIDRKENNDEENSDTKNEGTE